MAAPVRLRELFHVGIDPSLLALKGAQGELFHGQSSQLKSSGIWVAERYQESFKIQSLSLFLFCFSVGCWHTKAPKLPSCRLTGKWESSQGHPGCCCGQEHQGFPGPLVAVSLPPSPVRNGSHQSQHRSSPLAASPDQNKHFRDVFAGVVVPTRGFSSHLCLMNSAAFHSTAGMAMPLYLQIQSDE